MVYVLSFDIGIKNLAYCLLKYNNDNNDDNDDKIITIEEWNIVDISSTTYNGRCQKLIQNLNKIELNDKTNVIALIEKQPGINPIMRVISGHIFMYYALKQYNNESISKVLFFSPRNKLKCYQFKEGDEPIPPKTYSTKYQQRKYLSKQHCERMLKQNNNESNNNDKWIEYYNKTKKKDDLSDSYLQGVSYILINIKNNE